MVAWSEETPTVLRSEESVETKLLRIAEKARNEYVQTSANYRMRSRVRELRKHGSGRGRGQRMYGRNIVEPPGNQAENGENKPHPATSEETGLLDKR